jgi:hypothetical protein
MMSYFPGKKHFEVKETIRSYIRRTPQFKKAKQEDFQRSSVEYKADGTVISEKFIVLRDGDDMTPEVILEAHGLKPSAWEVVSYKNNFWNSQLKGGHKQISYQSKLTAKPKQCGYDFSELEKRFARLDRTYKPPSVMVVKPQGNMMAEVNIADLHLGKLCWRGDTGNNYDYKIARDNFYQIINEIVYRLKREPLEKIIFPIGNDFFNSDTPNKTTTAGTPQDTDVRWPKLQEVGEEMLIGGVDLLRTLGVPIEAHYVPSNHDEVTAFGVTRTLRAWFRNDSDVYVDCSPMARKYLEYGKTLLGFTHGSEEKGQKATYYKPSTLAALAPVEAREMWARTEFCEIHAAHLHGEHAVNEMNGVIVRRISSPTATDTWHYRSGYVGNVRKAQTFLYDRDYGLIQIINTPVI